MIKKLDLKFGRTLGGKKETFHTTPVTVFVGPNNSGKSRILKEIYNFCSSGEGTTSDCILENIEFEPLSLEEVSEVFSRYVLEPGLDDNVPVENVVFSKGGQTIQVHKQSLYEILQKPESNKSIFCRWFLHLNTKMFGGQGRIDLIAMKAAGDLQKPANSSLQALFQNDNIRARVRRILYDAIGYYCVVDPTQIGMLRLRLSTKAPENNAVERGLHKEAVDFHAAALPIENASDGIKAFVGIIIEIITGDPYILLIDEPEAFLHPSLSANLGKQIALASVGSRKRVFASTHSSSFVLGCIQSGAPINIVRLTHQGGSATARVLENSDLVKLMRNPLLRSTRVIESLFYSYVVVTEADSDRAFYQEINERLLQYKPSHGIPNCLFLSAQNKQTVATVLKPLRKLGIPVVGVVDIDVLKEGGKVWSRFLDGGGIPEIEWSYLSGLRGEVKNRLEATGRNMKRDGGLNLLEYSEKEAANNLCDRLAEYGLFLVRGGELESWLPGLGAKGHGPDWLVDMFEIMGEDPEKESYLKPSNDDVWAFISEIRNWLTDPNRKGIPS